MKKYKVYTKEKGIVESDRYDEIRPLTWHREDGPALIKYYDNSKIEIELYCINGTHNKLDGPAVIQYGINGNIISEFYYINDIEYTKEDYYKELLKRKINLL